ncbi:MAG: O-antigen ligase family protein [Candidatus Gottesmanbacteria bacterium]
MQRISYISDRIIHIGFILLALLVPLLLTPVNYELFEYNKMIAVYGITAIITLAWVGKMIVQKRIFVARTPFDIPIGLFVISQFVSALFSMDPHVSWFGYYSRFNGGMISVFCYTLLFYAFVTNITKEYIPKLTRFLFITGSLVAFYGVLQHFGIDKHIWVQDVQSRVFSTLGQPNWLAAYLVSLIPITLAIAYVKKTTWVFSIIPAGLSLLFFLTLLYTRSRSGLIAFAIVDILFWLVLTIQTKQKRTLRAPFFLAHIAFAVCIFFTGTHIESLDRWITFDGWKQQLTQAKQEATQSAASNATSPAGPVLETGGTESGVIRAYVWQAAINAWKSTPKTVFLGTGTETFAFAFYRHKPVGHNLTSEWDFLYNKAHNEYLNFLATTGILGLATYLVFLGSIAVWFIKAIIKTKERNVIILGIALGWFSILITNFFGFSVVVTQLLLFLLPAAAFIYQTNNLKLCSKNFKLQEKIQRIYLILILILLTITCSLLTLSWIADKAFATGYRLARASQYAKAYTPLTQAVSLNPTEPFYKDEYANTLASLAVAALDNQDATLAATLGNYAVNENNAAIAISPNNVNFWKSKTKIYYALSALDEALLPQAIFALQHAQTLSPFDPKITYNLAILEGKSDNADKAISHLKQAITVKPNYRDAYYALFIFYQETKQMDKARTLIQLYLTTVNSQDEEFKKLIE